MNVWQEKIEAREAEIEREEAQARAMFAAAALQGLLTGVDSNRLTSQERALIAKTAWDMADAMIVAGR